MDDDGCESRIYVGNLDLRTTEANVIKMFSPYGKIISEEFLWHTRGPKKGEPRGYAFIQYDTKEEAQMAKAQMNGKMAFGRPLVVRYACEKYFIDAKDQGKSAFDLKKPGSSGSSIGQMSRCAKIAAIKNKLKDLEQEGFSAKKSRTDCIYSSHEDRIPIVDKEDTK